MARGLGCKKIQIKKIENQSIRDVTFSKRRSNLYQKACELNVLCNCHVGIVIFSPTYKFFKFGHPSAEHIFGSFINEKPHQNNMVQSILEDRGDYEFRELAEGTSKYETIIRIENSQQKIMNNELQNDLEDENYINK